MLSKWINATHDACNPTSEYFNEAKLQVWLSNCDTLQDAHDRIGEMIHSGYMADMDALATGRIIGRLMYDTLAVGGRGSSSKLAVDARTQGEVIGLLTRASQLSNGVCKRTD